MSWLALALSLLLYLLPGSDSGVSSCYDNNQNNSTKPAEVFDGGAIVDPWGEEN